MKVSLKKLPDGRTLFRALSPDAQDLVRFLTSLEDILWERTASGKQAFSDVVHCEAYEAQCRMLALCTIEEEPQ